LPGAIGSTHNATYNNSAVPTATRAVGAYRLLRGDASQNVSGVSFTAKFIASAPSTYNQSEATNQVRVAYGANGFTDTVGKWCATCHPAMHSTGHYVHPIDRGLTTIIANNYGAYVSSGNMTGAAARSYLSLVPFAENTRDFTILKSHAKNDNSYLNGPASADKVMCLSCHRAHATGFPDMLRWNMEGEFITYADAAGNAAWPGTDTTPSVPQLAWGRTGAETQAAYYGRPATLFGAYQRGLCNKCHAQD
jgi:predicted CXXCH cytochrome family protein